MKRRNKILAAALAACMALGLAACGSGSGKGVDETYKAYWDNSMGEDVLDGVPEYTFMANEMIKSMVPYGVALEVELDLDKDGTYTLTSHYYNQAADAVEGAPGYMDVKVVGQGTYTKEEDKVTISAATSATASYGGGAYVTEQGFYGAYSFEEDGTAADTGEWTNEDNPEVLECVPETVFTVDDEGNIVGWELTDPNSGAPHKDYED